MSSNTLYPLKFEPILKDKIWGGKKLRDLLGKQTGTLQQCGESWEISGVPGNVSIVANGPFAGKSLNELIDEFGGQLIGEQVQAAYGNEFPLLIKFIDAAQDLSVQVHPNDALARDRHGSLGKSEMWYVMQADEGASLISGFSQDIDQETFLEYFNSGRLSDIINQEAVQQGDVFYIPAGRIHTIGKGLLIAEIQQTSDVTYRIYDFDRTDAQGNKRELHLQESLEAMDYTYQDQYKTLYETKENTVNHLLETPYFTTNKLVLDRTYEIRKEKADTFRIYICTAGEGLLGGVPMATGDVALVPAQLTQFNIVPIGEMELLETYLDTKL